MISNIHEAVLSQLVDGELDSDRLNEVLEEVLDDTAARERLKAHLRLRRALGQWRSQAPSRAIVAVHPGRTPRPRTRLWARLVTLAAAAVIGAALTGTGFLLASRYGNRHVGDSGKPVHAVVTPEQMAQVARVFEFHESVAGPLRWYADYEQHVQLSSAASDEAAARPVAILLRLTPPADAGTPSRTCLIVCRDSRPASIELPGLADDPQLRLYLQPVALDGTVDVRYAIGLGGPGPDRGTGAALAGRRRVGLEQTPLGQFVQNDRLLKVDASAWVVPQREVR